MWNLQKDEQLRSLVFHQHQYDWNVLAQYFDTTVWDVKNRWELKIYSQLRSDKKVAGAYIWTNKEDQLIQNAGFLSAQNWENLLGFLPGRTYFSLEARWKRIHLKKPPVKVGDLNLKEKNNFVFQNHQKRLEQYKRILLSRKQSKTLPDDETDQMEVQDQEIKE